ncbi:MFS general substrate transporter [Multifurca ochricompacta]|uniref:MFS general substrate transporter n=1 Tax=Multifurca ochricompacta TaxID=376703 RepID=A0AAD4QKG4_9AGAM|nr:MFS general substrate transporter [Multifurca ochricompacta]
MPYENSPLLPQNESTIITLEYGLKTKPETSIYDRFTPARKRMILTLVSLAGMIPLFVIGSFVPCIPQISRDLHTTGSVVNLAVSFYMVSGAIGNLTWSTYAGFYGRRPIYLIVLPIFAAGSVGAAFARSASELIIFRVVQAFGGGGGMSVGAGVISDIYGVEQRGAAMGIFFAASLMGPSLAPIVGGLAARYASWRVLQFALGLCGASLFAAVLLLLPETSWPRTRGIDKFHEAGEPIDTWRTWLRNPFMHISIFRSPNVLAVCLAGAFTLSANFALLIPLSYTIGARYNIKNEVLIGALLLPGGLGSALGAPLAGRLSDRTLVGWREKRNGRRVPEDRLRAALPGALILVPVSVLLSGVFTRYVEGTTGLLLNMACLFVSGIGADVVLTPIAAYNLDILHRRSAEAYAVTSALRHCITALATASFLPLINGVGVLATNAIAATVAWIGFVLLCIAIRYGERMRAWVDVGYSIESEY